MTNFTFRQLPIPRDGYSWAHSISTFAKTVFIVSLDGW